MSLENQDLINRKIEEETIRKTDISDFPIDGPKTEVETNINAYEEINFKNCIKKHSEQRTLSSRFIGKEENAPERKKEELKNEEESQCEQTSSETQRKELIQRFVVNDRKKIEKLGLENSKTRQWISGVREACRAQHQTTKQELSVELLRQLCKRKEEKLMLKFHTQAVQKKKKRRSLNE
ncbi:Protein FAM204A, partial [Galemys pyrenaicus]